MISSEASSFIAELMPEQTIGIRAEINDDLKWSVRKSKHGPEEYERLKGCWISC